MKTSAKPRPDNPAWVSPQTADFLRIRMHTFYNADYFGRVVLPLMDLPQGGRVLDVGCGYGGLSLLLAEQRPDLHLTGVDPERGVLESAAQSAASLEPGNLTFVQGEGQRLPSGDDRFDAVVCQTVLTHVADAPAVIQEMARVLKPGGVFMAAEYSIVGPYNAWNSAQEPMRDEAWYERLFRLSRLRIRGKKKLGWGDDNLGVRVPALAAAAGLDVFDVRLNDRVLHVHSPYRHAKQQDYLALLKVLYAPDQNQALLKENTELLAAAGATETEAQWLTSAWNAAAVQQAIEDGTLSETSAYMLFLTFARKPVR